MAAVFTVSRLQPRSALARWDSVFVVLALGQGALLLTWPSIPLVALGLWWSANTIAHNFIHRPFFRQAWGNAAFSVYLSAMFGFPQGLWRQRHLAHHAGVKARIRMSRALGLELAVVTLLWGGLLWLVPAKALTVYLPGWLLGLGLCQLQGYFEHRGATTSHYGRLYNTLFFNDGYHCEHHQKPGVHWTEIPGHRLSEANASSWPAALRWMAPFNLCLLERWVIHSALLQRFVVGRHQEAMRRLLASIPQPSCVAIVGGGLFPRTALVLERLLPEAQLVLIDFSRENLDIARDFLKPGVICVNERFDATRRTDDELIIIPLAYVGNRETIYLNPPAASVLVHDWIWRRRGRSVVISWLLLKRLNLVTQ
ncbi:MAG: fatty acid desaturase [Acidobacteriota bacterium]